MFGTLTPFLRGAMPAAPAAEKEAQPAAQEAAQEAQPEEAAEARPAAKKANLAPRPSPSPSSPSPPTKRSCLGGSEQGQAFCLPPTEQTEEKAPESPEEEEEEEDEEEDSSSSGAVGSPPGEDDAPPERQPERQPEQTEETKDPTASSAVLQYGVPRLLSLLQRRWVPTRPAQYGRGPGKPYCNTALGARRPSAGCRTSRTRRTLQAG